MSNKQKDPFPPPPGRQDPWQRPTAEDLLSHAFVRPGNGRAGLAELVAEHLAAISRWRREAARDTAGDTATSGAAGAGYSRTEGGTGSDVSLSRGSGEVPGTCIIHHVPGSDSRQDLTEDGDDDSGGAGTTIIHGRTAAEVQRLGSPTGDAVGPRLGDAGVMDGKPCGTFVVRYPSEDVAADKATATAADGGEDEQGCRTVVIKPAAGKTAQASAAAAATDDCGENGEGYSTVVIKPAADKTAQSSAAAAAADDGGESGEGYSTVVIKPAVCKAADELSSAAVTGGVEDGGSSCGEGGSGSRAEGAGHISLQADGAAQAGGAAGRDRLDSERGAAAADKSKAGHQVCTPWRGRRTRTG